MTITETAELDELKIEKAREAADRRALCRDASSRASGALATALALLAERRERK
jgi:hypothetical protein